MKYLILVFSMCLSIFSFFLNPQEKEIREDITVTNVEIPIRVIHKNNPVSGLKKGDFKLYVNGKAKEINGFYEEKRKIKTEESEFLINEKQPEPRLFILVFNISSFHLDVEKGVDYFFDNILKENDKLMVLINDAFLSEKKVENVLDEKKKIKSIIKKESKTANRRLFKVLLDLESTLRRLKYTLNEKFRPEGKSNIQKIQDYLLKYLESFREYKRSFLIPDINKYYNFAKFLDNRKEKKWVINFYQLEKFPKMKRESTFRREIERYISSGIASTEMADSNIPAREIQKLLLKIEREMNVANDFPIEQIKQLFLQVNTTFHTIFMKSNEIIDSEDYELKRISTDIENSLREITRFTGGKLLLSNNLEKSLQQVSEKEDVFYVISYSPNDEKEMNGKIKIDVNNKSYSILYNRNVYEDYFKHFLKKKKVGAKEIKIGNLSYKDYILSFDITEFEVEKKDEKQRGKVLINIKIVNEKSDVIFDQKKGLSIKEKSTKITIKFKKLDKGSYNAIVNVTDLINGSKFEDHIKMIIK